MASVDLGKSIEYNLDSDFGKIAEIIFDLFISKVSNMQFN